MAGNTKPVQVSVRSELDKIIQDLVKIKNAANETNKQLGEMGKTVGEGTEKQLKKTESMVGKTSNLMRSVLNNLKSDFKTLMSLEGIATGLSLSNQFKGSIRETIGLGDAIRKLGTTLGVASKDFAGFQGKMMRGLGDIGLSSESATKALEGLAETPVRGQQNLIEYAKTAGMLSSAFGEQGAEGGIAKGLSEVILARGGNVNDPNQMKSLAEDVRRASVATGAKPSEVLGQMQQLFASMPADMLAKMGTRQMSVLAAGAHAGGPGATQFIQDFMSNDMLKRSFATATGQTQLFDEKGFNIEGIKKFADHAKEIGGAGGIEAGLQFLGLQDDAAKGFVRLTQHLEQVSHAQEEVINMTGDLTETYKKNMTLSESFNANLNKLKGFFGQPIGYLQEKLSSGLQGASESTMGAGAVVAGGGALAAILAGGGLNALLNKMPGGGLVKGAVGGAIAKEAGATPVYVVNASDIGNNIGSKLGGLGAAGGMAAKASGALAAGAAGYMLGENLVNPLVEKHTQGTTSEGFEGNVMERFFFKLDKLLGGEASTNFQKNMNIKHEFEIKEGKLTPVKSKPRGPGY